MSVPNSDFIIIEINKILTSEESNDYDCISLYDVKTLVQEKYNNLNTIVKKYKSKLEKIIQLKFDEHSSIVILGFDYDKQYLKIKFKRYGISRYEEVYFSKRNDDLYVNELSKSPYDQDLLLHLGDILSELYDIYINYKDFKNEKCYNEQIKNSNLKYNITENGVSIYWNTGLLAPIYPEFSLDFLSYKNLYKYECNSNKILSMTKGKADEIFKKTFVKIYNCPKWMQKQLYEIRKVQLLSNEKTLKKEIKQKDNYELLMDEINQFLTKNEVDSSSTLIEIVSLYDLCNILKFGLEDLEKIYINSKLEKEFRKYNKRRNFFSFGVKSSDVNFDFIKQKSAIYLHSFVYGKGSENLSIIKDKNNNDIYFDCKENKENKHLYDFVRKNYDLIMESLETLEEYQSLIGELPIEMMVENQLFNIKLKINEDGRLITKIEINKNHELYNESLKNWYGRENISEYIEKHTDEILKRILINPYEMEESFKIIYDKSKIDQQLSKQKVKKIRLTK